MSDLKRTIELEVKATDSTGKGLGTVTAGLKEVDTAGAGSSESVKKLGEDVEKLDKKLDGASDGTGRLGEGLDDVSDEAKAARKRLEDLANGIDDVEDAADDAAGAADDLSDNLEDVEDAAGGAGKELDKAKGSITKVIGAIGSLVAVVAAFAFPIAEAAQFERAMSEVKAISGATTGEFEAMSAVARELGSTTEYTAQQAAEGFKYLAMAGLSANEAIAVLPGTLNLAQAGAVELGVAADIVTNVLSGYGLAVGEIGRVSDVLTASFTSTNSSLEEFGEAMKMAGPVAAAMGIKLESTAAAIGLLHNAGLKGTMAGTSLRGIIASLANPSDKASAALDKLAQRTGDAGFNAMDASGNFMSMDKLILKLEKSGMSATEGMKIFGRIAGPGLLALLSQGSEAIRQQTEDLENSKGITEKISKVMRTNLVGAWRSMGSAISEVSISFGDLFIPAATKVIKMLTAMATATSDFIKKNKTLVVAVTATVGSVIALTSAFKILKFGIAGAKASMIAFQATMSAGPIAYITTAVGSLFAGVSALTVGLVALAVAAVGFIAAFTFSDTFRGAILDFEVFGTDLNSWWDLLKANLTLWFAYLGGGLLNAFSQMSNGIKGVMGGILETVADWGIKILDTLESIPGLGKILGWASDSAGIKDALQAIKDKGHEMATESQEAAKLSSENYAAMVGAAGEAVVAKEKEIVANKALSEVIEKQKETQEAVEASAKEIDTARAGRLSELETANDLALTKLEAHQKAYAELSSRAEVSLSALAASTDASIEQIWGQSTSDTITESYMGAIAAVETSTSEWGERNETQIAEIQNRANAARLAAIKFGVAEINGVYSDQLENITTFENAKADLSQYSGDERLKQEKALAESVKEKSEEVYTKKKGFFEKARAALETELNKSLDKEKEIAGQIISVNEEIKNAKMTTEDKVRDLKRLSMSEEQVYVDKQKEYKELLSKAQELVGVDYAKSMEYAKKAQDVAAELTKETEDGTVVTSEAISKVQEAQSVMESAANARKSTLNSTLSDTKSNTESIKDYISEVDGGLDKIKTRLAEGFDAKISLDEEKFNSDISALEEKTKVKVEAEINFNQAFEDLKAFKAETQSLKDFAQINIEVKNRVVIETFFADSKEAVAALKEKIEVAISKGKGVDPALTALSEMAGLKVDISEGTVVEVTAGNSIGTTKIAVDGIADGIDDIHTAANKKTELKVTGLKEAATDAGNALSAINKVHDKDGEHTHSYHTVHVKTVEEKKAGGPVVGDTPTVFAKTGKRIPGYGGGDIIPAQLEPGEWVIRKEAVAKYGDGIMKDINAGKNPKFATGGSVLAKKNYFSDGGNTEDKYTDEEQIAFEDFYQYMNDNQTSIRAHINNAKYFQPLAAKAIEGMVWNATGTDRPDRDNLNTLLSALISSTDDFRVNSHFREDVRGQQNALRKTLGMSQFNFSRLFSRSKEGLPTFATGGSPDKKVSAMVEPGEWIMGKEAVVKKGDGFMSRLNAMILPIKRTLGGSVPNPGGMGLGNASPLSNLTDEQLDAFKKARNKGGQGFLSNIRATASGLATSVSNIASASVKNIPNLTGSQRLGLAPVASVGGTQNVSFSFGNNKVEGFQGSRSSIDSLLTELQRAQGVA